MELAPSYLVWLRAIESSVPRYLEWLRAIESSAPSYLDSAPSKVWYFELGSELHRNFPIRQKNTCFLKLA
jgi:hypothetical protein